MTQFGNEWRDYKGPIKEPMRAGVPGAVAEGSPTAAKRSKYGATKTEIDGIVFASRKEANRYCALKMMEAAGEIQNIEVQPRYELAVTFWMMGGESMEIPIGSYVADFRYLHRGQQATVVEDVKGFKTPLYRWKKKHVEAQYGITVVEV